MYGRYIFALLINSWEVGGHRRDTNGAVAGLVGHLLHQVLVLHGHCRQFLADTLVDVQVLGDAAVQAHRFALACRHTK